jgi:ADP-ribose pyrophosphatase YjhB (NUDIX family)
MTDRPDIQLIANLVVHDGTGRVLLADYDLPDEIDPASGHAAAGDGGEPARWWLPGHELDPYQHPDEAAAQALAAFAGIAVTSTELAGVQSFRGRRGWHVSFDYRVLATGEAQPDAAVRARWFDRNALPRTAHGAWERGVVDQVLGS